MNYSCDDQHHSKPLIKLFSKWHDLLCQKSTHYHNWHHHPRHKEAHYAILGLYIVTVASIIISTVLPNGAKTFAATNTWNFSGDNSVYDYDPNKISLANNQATLSNPGSATGATTNLNPVTGVSTDGAVDFSSANKEYLKILDANQSGLDFDTSDFAFAFWAKSSYSAISTMVDKGALSDTSPGYRIGANTNRTVAITFTDGTSTRLNLVSTQTVKNNEYSFVVVNFDRDGQCQVSIDGVNLENIGAISGRAGSVSSIADFHLGSYFAVTSFFNGSLDSVGAWNRLLTQAEITSLYNAGVGKIYSDLSAAEKTNLVSWYNFDETSGTRSDSHGSNNLTAGAVALIDATTLNGGFGTAGAGGADVFANWAEGTTGTSAVVRDTTNQRTGDACLRMNIDATNGLAYVSQAVLTIGRLYTIEVYVKGNVGASFEITGLTATYSGNFTADWVKHTYTGTAISTTMILKRSSASNATLYWDDVTLTSQGPILTAGVARGEAADGDDVSYWKDITANLSHFTQITPSKRPTMDIDGINSLPVLDFDGVDDALSNAADKIGTGDVTVVAVIKPTGWGGGSTGRIIDNGKLLFFIANTGVVSISSVGGASVSSANGSISLNTSYIVTVTRTSAGIANIYINGVLSGTANQDSGTPVAGFDTYIGNRAAGDRGFDGLIGSVMIFPSVLDATSRNSLEKTLGAKYGITVADTSTPEAGSSIYPTISSKNYLQYSSLQTYTDNLAEGSTGDIRYQLSNDITVGDIDSAVWYYFNGSSWVTADKNNAYQSNTALEINNNISTFADISPAYHIKWRAFFITDGVDNPALSSIDVDYVSDTAPPPNPVLSDYPQEDGDQNTEDASSHWYNDTTPTFSWSAVVDVANEGETPSGIAGYYVYFNTDNTALPCSAGTWQTGTSFTPTALPDNDIYYLRIQAKDNAGNLNDDPNPTTCINSHISDLFTYRFENTPPESPEYVSVSPSGYSRTNSFTFTWPIIGDNNATDSGGSELAGYQYKVNSGDWSSLITENSIELQDAAQTGVNIFYLRAVDNAGNIDSTPVQTSFYYNNTGPTAPTNLTVTPEISVGSNSFSFSWNKPTSYNGSIVGYYYSINELPSINSPFTTEESLPTGPYASRQDVNKFYIVAKDEAGNAAFASCDGINNSYNEDTDSCAVKLFTANTPAPGIPLSVEAVDGSNRDRKEYKVFLTWSEPTDKGAGFSGYEIERSSDGINFNTIGTTSSTTYADTGLESRSYSYRIEAKDNAGQHSPPSEQVVITPTGRYTSPPEKLEDPTVEEKAFSAVIAWETDREASSIISFGKSETELSLEASKAVELVKKHEVEIKGLEPETKYYYKAIWIDQDGNKGETIVLNFTTKERPRVSDMRVANITLDSATISWTSTTIATSKVFYGKTAGYGASVPEKSTSETTNHTVTLSNLEDSSTYHFQITGIDTDDNTIISDDYTFNTLTRPKISNLEFQPIKEAATTSLKFVWKTNVPTTSVVYYQDGDGKTLSESSADYVVNHEVIVKDLADQSNYILYAKSVDQFGNSAESDKNTYKTPNDTRPPKLKGLTVEVKSAGFGDAQKATVVVAWESDEQSTSQVEFAQGISGTDYSFKSREDSALSTSHVVIVSDLEPSKIYHLRAISFDKSGNKGISEDTTVITGKIQKSVIDIIVSSLQRSLGWIFTAFK